MPRPEGPLGPGTPEVEEFAARLRKLRQEAGGPGYRELARRAHFSATTLSDACGGRRLPTLAVTLAFVAACGGDVAEWEARWRAVEAGTVDARPVDPGEPPYQGLAPYGPDRAEWFFGREDLVTDLVDRVSRHRLLAVFGASGSGKSSLLRAGLVPKLAGGQVLVCTPRADPIGELAIHLAGLSNEPAGALRSDLAADPGHLHLAVRKALVATPPEAPPADLVLVVDQFEELFTLCEDEAARAHFVAALLHATRAADSRLRVVLGVRADHYGRCAELTGLPEALADSQVLVGPMTAAQVRDAVVRPAERGGAMVEGALVSTIVAQVAGRVGALPMASHALLEAWRRRRGNAVTLDGYEAAGGMAGAVAKTAESVWDGLDEPQRRAARHALSRLVEVGTGDEAPTARRVDRAEFDGTDPATAVVLARLADARLITVDQRTVQLAHEALLGAWPRLRDWIDDDRDGLRVHRQLTHATAGWQALDRDPGALYRGAALTLARAWAQRHPAALTRAERAFLDASAAAHDRWVSARRRRGRILVGALAAVAAVVTVLATVAAVQADTAREQRDDAYHRQLVADARARLDRDPQAAFALARQAYAARPDAAAEVVLRQATLAWRCTAQWRVFESGVTTARLSADGRYALAVTSGQTGPSTVQVWDRAEPGRAPKALAGVEGRIHHPAISADGRWAAAGQDDDGAVRLWDLRAEPPAPPTLLSGSKHRVRATAFSADGQFLATVDDVGVTRVWRLADRTARVMARSGRGPGYAVAFSSDGRKLASATRQSPARVWDLTDPARPPVELPDSTDTADWLVFSPDGGRIAGTEDVDELRIWDLAGGPPLRLGEVRNVAGPVFTADGERVVTHNPYGVIAVFDASVESDPLLLRGHEGGVWATVIAPTGELVSVGADGTVRTWDIGGAYHPRVIFPHDDLVHAVAFSPDGEYLATGGISDGQVRVRPATGDGRAEPVILPGHDGIILDLAFEPGGDRLASLDVAGTVRVWDRVSGRALATFAAGGAARVGFAGTGGALLTSGDDGVRRWDLTGGKVAGPVSIESPGSVGAFAPGGVVVTGAADGVLRVRTVEGRQVSSLDGHHGPVSAVAVSLDGTRAASLGVDSTIRSWAAGGTGEADLVTHAAAGEGTATSRLSFTPDGGYLAVLGGTELTGIQLWSATAAVDPVTVRVLGPGPMGFAFGPDGRQVATIHVDGSVRLWTCEVCGPVDRLLEAAGTRAAAPVPGR